MSRVIFKYSFRGEFKLRIGFPRDANPIVRHMGIDDRGENCIWIERDVPTQEENDTFVPHTFVMYATGESFDSTRKNFVGTIITPRGAVWHVYEDLA